VENSKSLEKTSIPRGTTPKMSSKNTGKSRRTKMGKKGRDAHLSPKGRKKALKKVFR